MILYRAGPLEGYFRNFNFRGGGAPHTTPQVEDVRYVIILLTLSPNLIYMHILIINEDILGTLRALHV